MAACFIIFIWILSRLIGGTSIAAEDRVTPSPLPLRVALFVFGDSSVDVGNNNRVCKASSNSAIYAASIKFNHGVNFASGGAGVLPETNSGLMIDFQTQLKQFKAVKNSLIEKLGELEARELISEAVYLVSIGSNDYMSGYMLNPKMLETFQPDDFVSMVIGNLSHGIQVLYEKGARKFVFLNLCPLGCLPALRAINPNPNRKDGDCFEDVSSLALAHNNALSAVLASLEYILKGFKYAISYFYSWLDDKIQNSQKYGFKDGVNACCGSGPYGGNVGCGRTQEVGDYKVCESSEEHIWWDSFHPSEKIHEQYAKMLWSGLPPSVRPYNIKSLFFDKEK